ncbi:hypothetical protein [Engelhardtia mirabilis]|uniref:hypothetical protein n=1 Tax=Engelhardtia mirabilis TaxID=2528011 RepID=UPI0011A70EB0
MLAVDDEFEQLEPDLELVRHTHPSVHTCTVATREEALETLRSWDAERRPIQAVVVMDLMLEDDNAETGVSLIREIDQWRRTKDSGSRLAIELLAYSSASDDYLAEARRNGAVKAFAKVTEADDLWNQIPFFLGVEGRVVEEVVASVIQIDFKRSWKEHTGMAEIALTRRDEGWAASAFLELELIPTSCRQPGASFIIQTEERITQDGGGVTIHSRTSDSVDWSTSGLDSLFSLMRRTIDKLE